ncbi:hypothetical protein N7G274_001596 [Stereocaulon virgatum]|uniref:Uncharacterized protein n=1 Tax=Stereocaulon virgatum TaxID=373712 RepID=A0ABR4AKW4_9LECA
MATEMEELPPRSLPSRSSTLESQRQPFRREPRSTWFLPNSLLRLWRIGGPRSSSNDLIDDLVVSAAMKQKDGPDFLDDYMHVSRKPRAMIHAIFDFVVELPPVTEPVSVERSTPPGDASLYESLGWVTQKTDLQYSDSFIMCIFTAKNLQSKAATMYKFLKPLPAQVQRRKEIPRRSLIYLLSKRPTWNISDDIVTEIAQASNPLDFTFHAELPSRPQKSSSASYLTRSIDLTICWQCLVPRFKSDLDTYLRQPFRTPPTFHYVKIYVLNLGAPRNLRACLLFDDPRSLDSFRQNMTNSSNMVSESWHSSHRLIHAILTAKSTALSDMMYFLQEANREVFNMTFDGRTHPSQEKIQHLIHLNDCRKRAQDDMASNSRRLKTFVSRMSEHVSAVPKVDETLGALLKLDDTEYIDKELATLGQKITDRQIEIESQIGLKTRNTAVLTFLAAVYIPLAFVTSFLGMNITAGSTWSSPSSSAGSGNSNPQLWDMKWFTVLSVPLLFGTIIVPIITGPVLRWLFSVYTKLKPFRRVIVIVSALTVALTAYSWFAAISDRASIYLPIASSVILLALGLHQTRRAFRTGQHKIIWLVYCGFTILCGTLNSIFVIVPTMFAALALFPAIHFVIYSRERLRGRRGKLHDPYH